MPSDLAMRALELRTQGLNRREIAKSLGTSIQQVDLFTREAIEDLHGANEDIVEEMFLIHQDRLEHLWSLVHKRLNDATSGFDEKVVKVALSILERQAKLLGLDKKTEHDSSKYSWTEDATPHELIAEVESYGISVPEVFKLPATAKDIRG